MAWGDKIFFSASKPNWFLIHKGLSLPSQMCSPCSNESVQFIILIRMYLSCLGTTVRWNDICLHSAIVSNMVSFCHSLFKGCIGRFGRKKKKKRQNKQKSCKWPHLSQQSLSSHELCHCQESTTSLPPFYSCSLSLSPNRCYFGGLP